MIISASRRTDIPAFYPDWFFNRLNAGFVLVPNPMNPAQVRQVSLALDSVDCFVFWTKNPQPMLYRLDELQNYPFYFQFTLNAYENDVEKNIPSLEERIRTFQELSRKIGPEKVVWRYDPILFTKKYTREWHAAQFEKIAAALKGYTNRCIFSYFDFYKKIGPSVKSLDLEPITEGIMVSIAEQITSVAKSVGMELFTCAETIDLSRFGIGHACCIDADLISGLTGKIIKTKKDPNQRAECGCAVSADIGMYDTCLHGCCYCYANSSPAAIQRKKDAHDAGSPILSGWPVPGRKKFE